MVQLQLSAAILVIKLFQALLKGLVTKTFLIFYAFMRFEMYCQWRLTNVWVKTKNKCHSNMRCTFSAWLRKCHAMQQSKATPKNIVTMHREPAFANLWVHINKWQLSIGWPQEMVSKMKILYVVPRSFVLSLGNDEVLVRSSPIMLKIHQYERYLSYSPSFSCSSWHMNGL